MELRIQYAKTKDGVSIAYSTLGEGSPLVHMSAVTLSHIQMEWQIREWRGWYERLAQKRMLVLYDCRGSGLSERDVTDYSLEAHVSDLGAVVDSLGLERFALLGWLHSGPAAIAYAARRSGRVSHLVLWCTYAHNADYQRSPQAQAFRALRETLVDQDWELFCQTWADLVVGGEAGELAHRLAAYYRGFATPDAVQAAMRATGQFDVTSLLPDVASPTLVLARREVRLADVGLARTLSSRISNAHLIVLEGTSPLPFLDDTEAVAAAIDEFLGEGEERAAAAPTIPSGTAIILFADIANSTALTERMGDAAFRDKARDLDTALRKAIAGAGGTAVEGKLLGDGVLAVFGAAREAIACSSACHAAAEENGLELHVGIHAGDVIREEGNVFGGAVNIAARVADASGAGETMVSQTVRDLARTSAGVAFEDRGEHELKGIDELQRLFAVRWREDR